VPARDAAFRIHFGNVGIGTIGMLARHRTEELGTLRREPPHRHC